MFHAPYDAPQRPAGVPPAWLLSMLIHLTLVVVLGLALRASPPGLLDEPRRTVGIVLKPPPRPDAWYEGEAPDPRGQGPSRGAEQEAAEPSLPTAKIAGALPTESPLDPNEVMRSLNGPRSAPSGGAAPAAPAQPLADARQFPLGGTKQPTAVRGGTARVRLFGLEGVGRKFVYVFDRSTSMEGTRLRAAKSQLVQSLDALESTHQFQIIFFNHRLQIFDLTGGQRRFPFATDATKRAAARWIASIAAIGNTERLDALRAAIGFRPDVIFFLTDDDNPMTPAELDTIRRKNQGRAAIHVVQFGYGRRTANDNFLSRLARENGGTYTYVDSVRLGVP